MSFIEVKTVEPKHQDHQPKIRAELNPVVEEIQAEAPYTNYGNEEIKSTFKTNEVKFKAIRP